MNNKKLIGSKKITAVLVLRISPNMESTWTEGAQRVLVRAEDQRGALCKGRRRRSWHQEVEEISVHE